MFRTIGTSKARVEGEWINLAFIAVAVGVLRWLGERPALRVGSLRGVSSVAWLWIALATAVLHQTYVCVHYLATERPDIRRIYGATGGAA